MSSYFDSRDIDKALLSFNTAFMISLIGSAGAVRLDVFDHSALTLSSQAIYLGTLLPALLFAISTYQILLRWGIGNPALPLLNPVPMATAAFLQIPMDIMYLLLPEGAIHAAGYVMPFFYWVIVLIGWLTARAIGRPVLLAQRHREVVYEVLPQLKEITEKPDLNWLERWRGVQSRLTGPIQRVPDVASIEGMIDGLVTDSFYGKDLQYTGRKNVEILEKVLRILTARLSKDHETIGRKSWDE